MSDSYTEVFGRNQTESQRLDEQLELLNQNIGYLLHSSVTQKLSQSPTIADIGTGTGLFLLQLAKIYPDATLRGFDISDELFPVAGSLPPNVELGLMDVKQPPPSHEHNRYDVVHVRLLVAGMRPADWGIAVRNLSQLLKPGGALQWEECNFPASRHLRGKVGSSVSAARFMGSLMRETLNEKFSYGWSTLTQDMKNTGLVHVEEDIVSSDRIAETREQLTTNGMVAVFAWAQLMSARGIPGSLPVEELEKREEQAYRDIRSGCYVRFDIHVAIGFKPE